MDPTKGTEAYCDLATWSQNLGIRNQLRQTQVGDCSLGQLQASMLNYRAGVLQKETASSPTMHGRRGKCRPNTLLLSLMLLILSSLVSLSSAAALNFHNCLGPNVINSSPKTLQFIPLYLNATFNPTAPSHNINITVYGNVAGQATSQKLPPPGDPSWDNPNSTLGKIPDVGPGPNANYTTFTAEFNVLDYTPYSPPATRFCNTSSLRECPIAPYFKPKSSNALEIIPYSDLPGFTISHDLYSSYAFTTINTVMKIVPGHTHADLLACVSADITPDLGDSLSKTLTYIPLVVLILVGIATACAAILSPWGSADVFRWTTNYGRDADLLRLVTPGFGDCLQYIQFIVLAGSLSLNYPGFYQPVTSKVAWSVLMFNQSFVSHGNGTQSLVDGIYAVNGTYGLDKMSQLVGMSQDRDLWAGAIVWLLVILAAFVVLIQAGFLCRWGYRLVSNTQEEDLRAKNMPLTVGNSIRIVFNYFLLPIVALSMYQLVVAGHSAAATVGLASILLVALIGFTCWLFWVIASTRPRSYLFDDLPTVLLYGSLYNTYSDNAATFALVPLLLTFVRGIAIGAVQPSGIAQIVLLAISEVILILTLNAFRPFHSPTSMNAFHTVFAVVRLLIILLSVAFVPSLGVGNAPRGWIGYVILLLHAIVLVFGFFLNACQTLIEVIARLAGAGGEEGVGGGATRGGLVKVFGMRQLSRRNPRRRGQARHSMASDAAILGQDGDQKSLQLDGGRSRSVSGSSAILLNRQGFGDNRHSVGLDSVSQGPGDTPTTSGGASAFSYLPGASQAGGRTHSPNAGIVNLRSAEASDPYYRPPRPRKPTLEAGSASAHNRGSWGSAEGANRRWSEHSPVQGGSPDLNQVLPISGRTTPLPAYLGAHRDRSDSVVDETRRSKTDYAIREVDFYYGVRGPALSNMPTRKRKTGPADPTGPVSSASGWVKSLFGGKTKEKGKGFEVVRSSRAPPPGARSISGISGGQNIPYSDDPAAATNERNRDLNLSDEEDAIGAGTRHLPQNENPSPVSSEEEDDDHSLSDMSSENNPRNRSSQIPQLPPSLPNIETGGGIELPSRVGSKQSSRPTRENTRRSGRPPTVPRKSSKRDSFHEEVNPSTIGVALSPIGPSPPISPQRSGRLYNPDFLSPKRLQSDASQRLPFDSQPSPSQESHFSTGTGSMTTSVGEPSHHTGHARTSSSVLGSLAPDIRHDRPSSFGYVQQHRASDNIHTAGPNDPPMLGSSAELVDDSAGRNESFGTSVGTHHSN